MAGQTINVSILADTKQFSAAMNEVSSPSGGLGRLGDMGKKMGAAVAAGLAVAGAAAAGLAAKSVGLASDLEQSIGGVDAVFKNVSQQVHDFAARADTALGLSKNSYNELATVIGTTLKNSGTPLEELAKVTDTLIGRSSDLAATFGGPVTDASNAMASALRGEFEPLRKYGISLNQAETNARALADTGKKSAAELTKQEKALATQALIMEQSTDAAGAFARESDTLAGQTERLKAQLENLGAEVGTALLPVLTDLVSWVTQDIVPALKDFGGVAKQVWDIFTTGDFKGGPLDEDSKVVDIAFKIRDAFTDMAPKVEGAFDTLQNAFTKAQDVLGPILEQVFGVFKDSFGDDSADGGIIGLVKKAGSLIGTYMTYIGTVISVALDVIGALWEAFGPTILALLSNAFEVIKGIVSGAMDVIEGIFKTITAVISGDWEGAWEGIEQILDGALGIITSILEGAMNQARILMQAAWDAVSGHLLSAWENIKKSVSDGVTSVLDYIGSLPGRASDALSNIGTALLNAGARLIDGFIEGIKSGFEKVKNKLSELTDLLPDWKGPASRDAEILKGAGQLVIGGFIAGMESQYGAVRSSLAGLTTSVGSTRFDAPALAVGAGVAARQEASSTSTFSDADRSFLTQLIYTIANRPISVQIDQREVALAVDGWLSSRRQ